MEVMSAATAAVDLQAETWEIQDSKSHAGRRVLKLLPESRSILAKRNEGPWAFPGKKPGAHLVDIQHSHEAVLKRAQLDFVLYDFRHTFATRMAEPGMDVATLAAILGHANLRTVIGTCTSQKTTSMQPHSDSERWSKQSIRSNRRARKKRFSESGQVRVRSERDFR